jgi:hypothetical protein
LDEYERQRRDIEQRVQTLAGQEEQIRSDAARQQQLAGIAASLEGFRERVQASLTQASFEQRRQLVLLLVDRVVATDADVEIRYVLPTSPDSEHVRFCRLRKDYFDDPPMLGNPLTALNTLPGNPQADATASAFTAAAAMIVSPVGVQLEWPEAGPSPPSGPKPWHSIQGGCEHSAVVAVGAAQRQAQRPAARL